MFRVINRYDEVFQIEIDGWCYGVTNYPGEISAAMVHRIIRELAMSFEAAIQHNVVFNVLEMSAKFSKAAKFLIHEKEVAFAILAQLPNPSALEEEQQCVLALVVDQIEKAYGGAIEKFHKRWRPSQRRIAA